MMKTSITGIESASWYTPLVLRGAYTDMIRQAAQLGYDGIELHLMDSDAVDSKAVIPSQKIFRLRKLNFRTHLKKKV